jgi:L-fuconolactonase
VLDLTRDFRWLLGVVGWVDLADPRAGRVLDDLARHQCFRGVRFSTSARQWLLDDAIQPGLHALAERNLSFDVLANHEQLSSVPALLRSHPDLRFVLDHLGGPPIAHGDLAAWHRDLAQVAALPNVAAKISGLLTVARRGDGSLADIRPAVRAALDCFGPQRLMFGGDWPVSLLAAPYASTLDTMRDALSELPSHDAEHIWFRTAQRVYRLEQTASI